MGFLWYLVIGYLIFGGLAIYFSYVAARLIPSRYPGWWEKHIIARDPYDNWRPDGGSR